MKDLVLLPLRFVAVLIVFLLVFTGVQVLIEFSQLPDAISANSDFSILPLIVMGASQYALPCIALTWVVLAFHVLHRRRFRLLLLLVLGLFSAASFFLSATSYEPISRFVKKTATERGFQIPEKRILADENGFVLINEDLGDKVKAIVYHSHGLNETFRFIEEGKKDDETRNVVFPEEGMSLRTDTILGGRDSMFHAPAFFADFASMVKNAIQAMYVIAAKSLLTQLAFAIGVTVYLSGLWLLVRATRWPLFNVFLTLAATIGLFALAGLAVDPSVAAMLSVLPGGFSAFAFPAGAALLGILMIGVNLFMPPVKDWQREVSA